MGRVPIVNRANGEELSSESPENEGRASFLRIFGAALLGALLGGGLLLFCAAPAEGQPPVFLTDTSTGIDQDGDGTEEVSADGATIDFDPDDDATSEVSIASTGAVSIDAGTADALEITSTNTGVNSFAVKIPHTAWYSSADSLGNNIRLFSISGTDDVLIGAIDAGNTDNVHLRQNGEDRLILTINSAKIVTGTTNSAVIQGFDGDRDWEWRNEGNGALSTADYFNLYDRTAGSVRLTVDTSGQLGINDTSPSKTLDVGGDAQIQGNQINSSSTATCADSGDANPGALTITPTTSNTLIDNDDADGCDLTLDETGATGGQQLELTLTESAGGTVSLADSAGVAELDGGTTMTFSSVGDGILLVYHDLTGTSSDAWYERSRMNL